MNCIICNQEISKRGGSYCGRCAGLNGVLRDWNRVKATRTKEIVAIRQQRTLFDPLYCPCDTPSSNRPKKCAT